MTAEEEQNPSKQRPEPGTAGRSRAAAGAKRESAASGRRGEFESAEPQQKPRRPSATEKKPQAERRYGGLTAAERRLDRRERLIEAALGLFGTKGFRKTTIEQVCSSAGVTARHFYEEFESRDELLIAVYDKVTSESAEQVINAVSGSSDAPNQLLRALAGVSAWVHSLLDDPRRARIIYLESVGVSREFNARRREVIHWFAGLIRAEAESLAAQGVIPERDFSLGPIALVGAASELMIEWVSTNDPPPVSRIIGELVAIFVAAATAPDFSEGIPGVDETSDS